MTEKPRRHAVERKEVIVWARSQCILDLQDPPNTGVFCWQSLSESNSRGHQLAARVFPMT
jgi:hypothetical protein